MPLPTPRFWYRRRPSWQARLLTPAGLLYALAVRLHRTCSQPLRLPVPVVSVGNITLGGTGKTPLVLALARELAARGLRPAVLTRGYGSGRRQPLLVRPDLPVEMVGDEALELAAGLAPLGVPVWAGSDRATAAHQALAAGAELLLLDDGLQHWRLARDCDVTVLDAVQRLGNALPFPAGPLRETAPALGRADLLVLTGQGDLRPGGLPWPAERPWLAVSSTIALPEALLDRPLLAFCGIGLPEKFFQALRQRGCHLVGEEVFPDHHPYAQEDLERLLARARGSARPKTTAVPTRTPAGGTDGSTPATLVTTVKDWQRLAPLLDRAPHPAPDTPVVVPVPLELDAGAVGRLTEAVLAQLAHRSPDLTARRHG